MVRTKKALNGTRISAERRIREETQRKIMERYGERRILQAKERLCVHCIAFCNGLGFPITSDGSDCPYYQEKE